nr:MAG TPA: transcription repressor [Caudoviricetes sp.]DAQ69557.1 MAG TPA: transcription repressor [Caudoviricetes sp.]DAU83244.1 MAG TPA: transcription repressor [Caudoviricetes sp.]DAV06212.1 MAG TPA: transcription repressor [Caudoviricetes sp.]
MSERTLRNKLQNPTSIKLGELYKLADMVGISINIKYKDIPD